MSERSGGGKEGGEEQREKEGREQGLSWSVREEKCRGVGRKEGESRERRRVEWR